MLRTHKEILPALLPQIRGSNYEESFFEIQRLGCAVAYMLFYQCVRATRE